MKTLALLPLAALLAATNATAASPTAANPTAPIDPARIKADDRTLSSDAFGGRGPGEPGEARAIDFIAKSFAAAGLEPGGDHNGWYQDVPLVRLDRLPGARLSVRIGRSVTALRPGPDAALNLRNPGAYRLTAAPLVFAGWGVVDPARGWDPYAGVDVRSKVVVLLANDPDFEAGRDLGFGGRARDARGTPRHCDRLMDHRFVPHRLASRLAGNA